MFRKKVCFIKNRSFRLNYGIIIQSIEQVGNSFLFLYIYSTKVRIRNSCIFYIVLSLITILICIDCDCPYCFIGDYPSLLSCTPHFIYTPAWGRWRCNMEVFCVLLPTSLLGYSILYEYRFRIQRLVTSSRYFIKLNKICKY